MDGSLNQVLKGTEPIVGRPGASLEPFDFGALQDKLQEKHNVQVKEVDLMSAALYPKVSVEDGWMDGWMNEWMNECVIIKI